MLTPAPPISLALATALLRVKGETLERFGDIISADVGG